MFYRLPRGEAINHYTRQVKKFNGYTYPQEHIPACVEGNWYKTVVVIDSMGFNKTR